MAIADIVVLVLVAIFLIIGYIRGFLSTIFGFLGGLISLIVAVLLCGKLATLLDGKFGLVEKLGVWVGGWFEGNAAFNTDISSGGLEAALKASAIPSFISDIILKIPAVSQNELAAGTTIADLLAPTIAYYILCFICLVALYIVIRILFAILKALAKRVNDIPIIGFVNRIIGAVLGIVEGIIVVYGLLFVMTILPEAWMEVPKAEIEKSTVCKYLSDTNLLGEAISGNLDLDAISDMITGKKSEGSIVIDGATYDLCFE